ncbi:hypothetical protein [Mesoterricola silvestris]|uniref:Uncharacterized protein n=1 Tax=Mesoterricola silvestris TaxID=2927979 RepID=A0AA48GNQ4_9BACT|nr:hypothetical protein [Mesoterricola silvestris]BDU73259.1 hypothetical protein METEAL_24330 [Mesoterricola silvestris]
MPYTREELDWMEAEWAFHLHGRQAFMSREDFLQLQVWDGEGIPADAVVGAMEAYFERRAKREKPRTWVALSHLAKDVARAVKLRAALGKVEAEDLSGWEAVKEPLRSDPRARAAFEAWKRFQAAAPPPDSPGFLDHFDQARRLHRDLLALAEAALGARAEALRESLLARLAESKLQEGTLVWKRAWDHHWNRAVCDAWGME